MLATDDLQVELAPAATLQSRAWWVAGVREVRGPALLIAGGAGALWPWLTGSAQQLAADPLTGMGRAAGLLAGYLIAVQVMTMSRIPSVQRFIGTRTLSRWHRIVGTAALLALCVHIGFITAGYAAGRVSLVDQTWQLLTGYQWILAAWAGSLLLFAIGLTSLAAVRRRFRYESWYYLHVYAYLAGFLAFLHQITLGADLLDAPGRALWIGLYATAAAVAGYGRLARPLLLAVRYRFRVSAVVPEGPNVTSVYVKGRRLARLAARPGQFLRFRFLTRTGWWQAHPFSLSAMPSQDRLRITVKASGDHTAELRRLASGTRVLVDGPFGEFTADRRIHDRVLLVAAGIGITPVRALLEGLPPGRATVIYRAHSPADAVLRDELDRLAAERDATVVYLTDRAAADRVLSPEGLAPLVEGRDVYLCGPSGLVAWLRRILRQLEVPRACIHTDPFDL